jgi:hypothetical protein
MWTAPDVQQLREFEQWFDLVEDPWYRAQAALRGYWARESTDPEQARQWVTSVPNVDRTLIDLTLRRFGR